MADVKKITISGKELPFYFGMNAISIYDEVSGGNFFTDMSKLNIHSDKIGIDSNMVVGVAYAGIKDGHRKLSKPFNFTREDVADLFDEDLGAVQVIFEQLMTFGIFRTAAKQTPTKKKVAPKVA